MGRKRPTHDKDAAKPRIIELLAAGKSVADVADELCIGRASMFRWAQADIAFGNAFQKAQYDGARASRASHGSAEQCAYVAGFFDGEGCIRLQRGLVQKNGKRYYFPVVLLGNTNCAIIDFVDGLWNGNRFTQHRNANNPNARPMYVWQRSGVAAEVFLQDIGPFLRVKKAQADLVSEFLAFAGDRRRTHDESPEFEAHLIDFYVRMTRLNHRGLKPPKILLD